MSVAYIPLSGLNLGALTNNMGVSVNTQDSNGNPINICTTTGNFSGATLDQVINTIVSCINTGTGTHGFAATNANPRIKVDSGTTTLTAGVSITINIRLYYLKNEQANSDSHTAIGYTATTTGRPAYVAASKSGYANDLEYIPLGDSFPNIISAQTFDTYTDGSSHTANIGANKSAVVFANGLQYVFEYHPNASDFYIIPFTITGYNSGTGVLSFTIGTITKTISGVSSSASPMPALGSVNWILNIGAPGWGTVAVYNIDAGTGIATLNTFIQVHADTIREAVYDENTNAVLLCCGGGGRSQCAKILMSSPFAVNSILNINAGGGLYGFNMKIHPVNGNIYYNSGNTTISKFTNALVFNNLTNVSGNAASMAFDDLTGRLYYAGETANGDIKYLNCNANPDITDTGGTLFTMSDFGQSAAPYATGNYTGVNAGTMWLDSSNKMLFVIRNTDTFQEVFQSYDISSGNASTIDASMQVHTPPNGMPLKLTWQEGAQRLFVTTNYQGGTVYFFNTQTLTWESSSVNVTSGVSLFSYTDDPDTPNFFGINGGVTEWMSVISILSPAELLSGIFLDEAVLSGCDVCYEYPLIACYNSYVFDLDLSPDTVYNLTLTDKFGKKYRQQVTSDSDGKVVLDPEPFPEGLFTPENGNLYLTITDANNTEVQIVFGYTLYTCLLLVFEYNNLYE